MPIRLSGLEFLALLVIILVLFGPGRLSKIAGELGRGIQEWDEGPEGCPKRRPGGSPRTARKVGTMIKEIKAYVSELSSGLKEELDLLDELEEIKKDLEI